MYLTKNFETVRHVFQPKFIFSSSLLNVDDSKHPFFKRPPTPDLTLLSNPRWDINDELSEFMFYRVELSNRFLIRETSSRFLLIDLANQYNAKTNPYDPRYKNRLGPLEALIAFDMGRFSAQIQASYQLQTVRSASGKDIHESDWSGKTANVDGWDNFTLGTSIHNRKEEVSDEQTIVVTANKQLPIYLNVGGGFEYSAKKGNLRTYNFSVGFAQKPNSCWTLTFTYNRDPNGVHTTLFNFGFLLGGPMNVSSGA